MGQTRVTHSRAEALVPRIDSLDEEPAQGDAVTLGLVDALLENDDETLSAAFDALRDVRARADGEQELIGWLDAAIAFSYWGLERLPPHPVEVPPRSRAHDFLSMLDTAPRLGSVELRRLLETDETQVSRTGRRLLESGLVTRHKVGRQVFWQLTPRGRRAVNDVPAAPRTASAQFWQDALRRGFEAASGEEPGEPREVDPTRQRIIKSTLELHVSQGIQATTRSEIADMAGVPVETVEELFPTQDSLVRSCGQHAMERLQFPSVGDAPAVFAGASSENERIRRLVATCFGAYERGADGIAAGRRERKEIRLLDESMEELDNSFDALVLEALRPQGPDSSSVTAVRALTDLEVWRTIREQGATPEAAVEQGSAAVERWLEANPAR